MEENFYDYRPWYLYENIWQWCDQRSETVQGILRTVKAVLSALGPGLLIPAVTDILETVSSWCAGQIQVKSFVGKYHLLLLLYLLIFMLPYKGTLYPFLFKHDCSLIVQLYRCLFLGRRSHAKHRHLPFNLSFLWSVRLCLRQILCLDIFR